MDRRPRGGVQGIGHTISAKSFRFTDGPGVSPGDQGGQRAEVAVEGEQGVHGRG